MGYCVKIEKKLKWYQKLWNILIGHKEKNYYIMEIEDNKEEKICKK